MPFDGSRKNASFLGKFLLVVFAEVSRSKFGIVKGEDVVGGLQFGDRH